MAEINRRVQKESQILRELEQMAKGLGLNVFSGRLSFHGLKLKSGHCSLRHQPWLIVDSCLSFDERLEVFKKAFGERSIHSQAFEGLSKETLKVLVEAIEPAGALLALRG
ncbi:MAG: hypothetical protein LBV23_01935 [Deltaproteobacteria bacterium]|jgi:uncharacterized membrane protein|nr:hypothetical protein [Deltaproteobacteria bacterium]